MLFQITLDGNREQHNKIKHPKSSTFDAFSATVNNIRNILDHIKLSYVAVRINFDQDTLKDFDSILEELQPLDRKRTKIILKKVWQVDVDNISQALVLSTMENYSKLILSLTIMDKVVFACVTEKMKLSSIMMEMYLNALQYLSLITNML